MKYRLLGRTGMYVSELCMGTMTFGGAAGMWKIIGDLDQAASTALVKQAFDAGVNFFDTANIYGFGAAETITGAAIFKAIMNRYAVEVIIISPTEPFIVTWPGDMRA